MKSIFICYPKCSTCQKARKFLEEKGIEFEERHIVEQNPKQDELKRWIAQSGLPIKRFFNTSGLKYKALQLKDKLPNMTETEQIELLATDGMLVKRPLLSARIVPPWSSTISLAIARPRPAPPVREDRAASRR